MLLLLLASFSSLLSLDSIYLPFTAQKNLTLLPQTKKQQLVLHVVY